MTEEQSEYSTCPHLSDELALSAAQLLLEGPEDVPRRKRVKSDNNNNERVDKISGGKFRCVQCSLTGSRQESAFQDHFSNSGKWAVGHSVAVDLCHREMYCMRCLDYQYHHLFDRLLNHCRPSKDFPCQRRKFPQGITNMGSTCFMSSVLQLLISSPALVRFFEISECFVVKCKIDDDLVENEGKMQKKCIFCELQKVFLHPYQSDKTNNDKSKTILRKNTKTEAERANASPLVPSSLLFAVWSYARHLASYDQQDAHEFLLALLDGLGAHLQKYHGDLNAAIAMKNRKTSSQCGTSRTPHFCNSPQDYNGSYGNGSCSDKANVPVRRVVQSPRSHVMSKGACDASCGASTKVVTTPANNSFKSGGFTPNMGVSPKSPVALSGHSETLYEFRGIVNEVFSGVLSSDLICQSCGNTSTTYDPFLDLSLSVDDVGAPLNRSFDNECTDNSEDLRSLDTQNKTIQDCFNEFTAVEELHQSMVCSCCNADAKVLKKLNIHTPPNVLIIHMKRFEISLNGGEIECVKINKEVEFPMYGLDLLPFIKSGYTEPRDIQQTCSTTTADLQTIDTPSEEGLASHRLKIELPENSTGHKTNNIFNSYDVLYDLNGVVCHRGKSLTQGHYVSYVKKEILLPAENRESDHSTLKKYPIKSTESSTSKPKTKIVWLKCDDEVVSEVHEEEVKSTQGYLLFYVRRAT